MFKLIKYFQLLNVLLVLKLSRCAQVLDHHSQRVLKISDYCPQTPLCPEGSHVMCSYQSKQRFGPRCGNPQPQATMNARLSRLYIDIVNMVRSEAANGNAVGKDTLPRGYGIMRLKWDEELATFAQTLADQCVLRHDLCRASHKFPNPGQTIGYIHLTLHDWQPIRNKKKILPKQLADETLEYAIQNILKTAYDTKANILPRDIFQIPDFQKEQGAAAKKMYLQLVSRSTHVGCGLSAFSDIKVQMLSKDPGPIKYGQEPLNVILLVCNYGEDVKPGSSAFDTERQPGSTKCGCPQGTWEDENCLCNEEIPPPPTTTTVATTTRKCSADNSAPTVVLLPIVTVEDAPPDKLFDDSNARHQIIRTRANPIADEEKSPNTINFFEDPNFPFDLRRSRNQEVAMLTAVESNEDANKNHITHNIRQYNRAQMDLHRRHLLSPKKSSIFTRVPKFQLPIQNSEDIRNFIKKDVAPRKDFSNIQQIVNDYMNRKNGKNVRSSVGKKLSEERLPRGLVQSFNESTTETVLHNAEDQIMNSENYFEQRNENNRKLNPQNEDNDNRLIALLDTLEREVKHVELDGNEKEIFDAKLRKIYGTVVGKPVDLLTKTGLANHNIGENKDFNQYDLNTATDSERNHYPSYYSTETDLDAFNTNYSNIDNFENDHDQLNNRYSDLDHDYGERTDLIINNNVPEVWDMHEMEHKYSKPSHKKSNKDYNKNGHILKRNEIDFSRRLKYRQSDKFDAIQNKINNNINMERTLYPIDASDGKNQFETRSRNFYLRDGPKGILSKERRKYYQEKLDAIEKKLKSTRRRKSNDKINKRQSRRIVPDKFDYLTRRQKGRIDEVYMPDRAKYLHGF